jgi:hypothetical protein
LKGPTRLVQWTRRLRLCLHLSVWGGAPLTSIVKHQHTNPPSMNTKHCFLTALLALSLSMSGLAEDGVSVGKTNEEWQVHTYPESGLKIRLPHWKADIEDQSRIWCLLAYPLVKNPAADVQYRVLISADKYTKDQYLRLFRNPDTKSTDWSLAEHLQTSQMTNAFWIYSRRDVWCSNGFSYTCTGRIKRIQNRKPEALESLGGSEEKLAAEVRRVLDSIEILPTNSTNAP